ncbi:MAG: site-specific DNA-methyltransferase [Chloroflexi bacterium]|nr:site-specific DNA-methyltransferase [Chloroflexota bacterium]
MSASAADETIKLLLTKLSKEDPNYWSFRGAATREHAHAFVQYPAMMVPQMQAKLISIMREVAPWIRNIYDPYLGSGTIMTESMLQGLDFKGDDINPLAVLICQAKSGPFFPEVFKNKIIQLAAAIDSDNRDDIDVTFVNRDKWFREDVAPELTKIRRAVQQEPSEWCRKLCWLALAETVRLTSNSRTSTYKLHVRPGDEINSRPITSIAIFKQALENICQKLEALTRILLDKGLLNTGHYKGSVQIRLHDTRIKVSEETDNGLSDLLLTSPPYGDNDTTVPYGQFSYLPLQWIDLQDIHESCDSSFLNTTHEIDKRSLGGIKAKALKDVSELRKDSPSLDRTLEDLKSDPRRRAVKVAAFYRDFNDSLNMILSRMKDNAYMVWTVGNRRVANKLIPMDNILSELLVKKGAIEITRFQRTISSKRNAVKNNIAPTMSSETVLIMRRGGQ